MVFPCGGKGASRCRRQVSGIRPASCWRDRMLWSGRCPACWIRCVRLTGVVSSPSAARRSCRQVSMSGVRAICETGIYLIEEGRIRSYYAAPSRTRGDAGLLVCRQFRRRPGSVRYCCPRMVFGCSGTEPGDVLARPSPARAGASIGKYRGRAAGCARLQGTVLLGHGANAGDPLGDRAVASSVGRFLSKIYGSQQGR